MENKDAEMIKIEKSNQKSDIANREESTLKFWQDNKIFEKSTEKQSPKGEFVFFEGPPTANAKPALHHLESRSFKDVLPRYKTMQGFHVRRKAGWDTHGLPVELQIEKKLGLDSKKKIEEYGVAKFNKECKDSVFEFIGEWEKFTDRMGYWVDKENAYYTFDTNYIESLWNVVSKINDKGLFYKDYRIVSWCPRCGTALASHELAQGYQEVKDLSVYVKFKIKGYENAYILVWTTTPWTLPGNVALAVGKDIDYAEIKIKSSSESYLLAKEKLNLITEDYEIVKEYKGEQVAGLPYEPLFSELQNSILENNENAFKVYAGDFVNTTDGTGIVHIAPMYGADDFDLAKKNDLPKVHTVDENGNFIANLVPEFLAGRYVKETDENGKPTVAVDIVNYLKDKNLFFNQENIKHTYPHCWRCKTPLIYYARDSWYIAMSKLRQELLDANATINWQPEHIKEGRFGEWLREVRDWAISRERYWGTPLPIWEAKDGEKIFVDSFETLKKYTKKSGNKYIAMRHGHGQHIEQNVCASLENDIFHLTEQGKEEVKSSAEKLKNENISMIFVSPLIRTQETAKIVADILGISQDKIITDERIREFDYGNKNNCDFTEFFNFRTKNINSYDEIFGATSFKEVKKRIGEFMYEIENKYQNENILIVSHGVFFETVESIVKGDNDKQARQTLINFQKPKTAEFRKIYFVNLPHNENFELDPHKPFIDEIIFEKDGKEFVRTKEVMDCWFDSGSMPYAQDHYPFENKEFIEKAGIPADFISEGIDQTRGWFYTLLAVGVLVGNGSPYKNVICLGHLLDKEGRKMSKSIGNIIEPFEQMDKFGVDAVRFWMYSVNAPGEGKNYDEKSVEEIVRKVFQTLDNCYKIYELYKTDLINENTNSENILDKWILAKLSNLTKIVTENLDAYNLFTGTREIKDFINDFSTWYIRRSRDRFKGDNVEDKMSALATTQKVLLEMSKLLAPFCPFYAEDLYQRITDGKQKESVHLESWPEAEMIDEKVMEEMEIVRDMVSSGMLLRQKSNIRVKQPLLSITFKNNLISQNTELTEIIKDELNIKNVLTDESLETDSVLDTNITPELKLEGNYRELLRAVQDMRKEENLNPSDVIDLIIETDDYGKKIIETFKSDFAKTAGIKEIIFKENFENAKEIKIGETLVKVKIGK